jgi:hypothetical protein
VVQLLNVNEHEQGTGNVTKDVALTLSDGVGASIAALDAE